MNLVQINERLKDLPMQVVQQYANGMNPEVPPYLALGELQRREMSQKQMATAQGAMQGAQPSVKEQVEQKAGLMALQQMQQQQMAQQQAQPRGPMPTPAGVPQPEPQPEAMMARGGLAGIPVRRDMFEYAGGGIVAFAEGGDVAEKYRKESEEMGEGKRTKYSPDVQAYVLQKRAADNAGQDAYMKREQERQLAGSPMMSPQPQKANQVGTRRYSSTPYGTGYDLPENVLPPTVENVFFDKSGMRQGRPKGMSDEAWNKARLAAAGAEQQPTSQGPGDQFVPRYPQSGLPAAANRVSAAAPTAPRPPMPRPPAAAPAATPQAGPPAAPQDKSPYFAQMDADLARPITAPTPEGIVAQQKALAPEAMKEEAMKQRMQEQRDRAAGERTAFEKTRPSGLDDLIRVFGQAGQYKGLSGTGPAYTANQQQKRAEELAMEKRQNELLSAIDTREYEGAKELFGARSKSMDAANTSYQNQLMTRTKSLADIAGVDQRRMDEAANRLSQMQIEKLRIAARAAEANRPGEAERIEAKYMGMIAKGQAKEAEDYLSRISKIKGGSGGDRNPTPTDRLRAAQSIMNDIDSTPEEKAMAKKEIAGIMAGSKPSGDGAPSGAAPAAAVDALRKNPGLAAQFDQKYGKGAAAQYLQK